MSGSVSAVQIDDKVILMGWYFNLYREWGAEEPDKKLQDNVLRIAGHNVPAIVLKKNESGFESMTAAFERLEQNYRQYSGPPFFGST